MNPILNNTILLFYTIFAYSVSILFHLASLFHKRPRNFLKLRAHAKQTFLRDLQSQTLSKNIQNKECVWFHAASVGELEQAKAMANYLKSNHNRFFLIVSWLSDSVTEKHFQDSPFDYHIPLPLDLPGATNLYFVFFRPQKLLIFAWDTWIYLIRTARKYKAQVYLVCASLQEKSGRGNLWIRNFTRLIFQEFSGIFPSHPILLPQFQKILKTMESPPYLEALGDTRFEAVVDKIQKKNPPESFQKFQNLLSENSNQEKRNTKIFIFASTYPICEEAILSFMEQKPQVQSWIFPHKLEDVRIKKLKKRFEEKNIQFSLYSKILSNEESINSEVILFDEMGILAFAYRYGWMAYVGGALHFRIHNTIEPAYFGLPLLSGKNIQNASEAILLKEMGGLVTVENPNALINQLKEWSQWDRLKFFSIGEKNKNFVLENLGASRRIYQRIWENQLLK